MRHKMVDEEGQRSDQQDDNGNCLGKSTHVRTPAIRKPGR
jgi:hypothetical protein